MQRCALTTYFGYNTLLRLLLTLPILLVFLTRLSQTLLVFTFYLIFWPIGPPDMYLVHSHSSTLS